MRTRPARSVISVLGLVAVLSSGAAFGAPAASATTDQARQEAAAFRRALTGTGATLGAEVVGDDGAVLTAVNPGLALPPASTQKIATIGAALRVLGPAHRFTTQLQGTIGLPPRPRWKGLVPTVYGGSLLLIAGGDPSLRMSALPTLFSPLLRAGVRTVLGGLWLDSTLFDRVRDAPGWKPQYVGTEVGPLSAFMLEENLSRSDPAYLSDPDMGNLQIVRQWLAGRGVTVLGGLHVGRPPQPAAVALSAVRSKPLAELAAITLRDSVNSWAEMLLKDLSVPNGVGSTAGGLQVERGVITAAGGQPDAAVDGSGLSGLDRATAQQEVGVLRALAATPIGAGLLASLPVSCAAGTLQDRLCAIAGRVHAKTGTLDTVAALTGYVLDPAGTRLWFSVQVGAGVSAATRLALIDRAVLALAGS